MIKGNKFKQILLTTTLLTTVNSTEANAAGWTFKNAFVAGFALFSGAQANSVPEVFVTSQLPNHNDSFSYAVGILPNIAYSNATALNHPAEFCKEIFNNDPASALVLYNGSAPAAANVTPANNDPASSLVVYTGPATAADNNDGAKAVVLYNGSAPTAAPAAAPAPAVAPTAAPTVALALAQAPAPTEVDDPASALVLYNGSAPAAANVTPANNDPASALVLYNGPATAAANVTPANNDPASSLVLYNGSAKEVVLWTDPAKAVALYTDTAPTAAQAVESNDPVVTALIVANLTGFAAIIYKLHMSNNDSGETEEGAQVGVATETPPILNLVVPDLINNTSTNYTSTNYTSTNYNEIIKFANELASGKINSTYIAYIREELKKQGENFKNIEKYSAALSDDAIKTLTKAEKALVYIKSVLSTNTDTEEVNNNNQKKLALYFQIPQEAHALVNAALGSRMDVFNSPAPLIAVAAGDDDNHIVKGVWTSGFYGVNKQSASKDSIGYKGTVAGGSVGVDFDINEDSFVGISYSNAASNIKLKQKNAGDKINATSHILGLYGQHQVTDNLSLKAVLSAGKTKVNSKRIVRLGNDKAVANAKINNTSYGIEAIASYLINAGNNISVTPNLGFRYGHYKDSAFAEKGAGVQNITVKGKSYSEFTGIIGTRVAFAKKISEDLTLIPSMHASIEHNFKGKQPKTKAKFTWMDEYFESAPNAGKKANTSYNLGASLLAKHKNIDLSTSYNMRLKKKFIAHQGSLQLKVNF